MFELTAAAITLACLLLSYLFGLYVNRRIPRHWRSSEMIGVVRLVIGTLVTFAALILGLLTNSVKSSFDSTSGNLRVFASEIIGLDHLLRAYGSEADPMRALLRSYLNDAIAQTWPNESPPAGTGAQLASKSNPASSGLENAAQGSLLYEIETAIRSLEPHNNVQIQIAQDARATMRRLIERRWAIIESQHVSIPGPFLVIMIFWLAVVFASFGLNNTPGLLVHVTVVLAAISLTSVVYLILDMESAFTGPITVSSAPLRDALAHLGN